jgi:hypothetical protein
LITALPPSKMVDVGRAIRFALDIRERNGQPVAAPDPACLRGLGPDDLLAEFHQSTRQLT